MKNAQSNFHNFSEEWTRSRRRWRSSPTRLRLQKQELHTLKTSRQLSFLHRIHLDSCTLWGHQGKIFLYMIKFIKSLTHFEGIMATYFFLHRIHLYSCTLWGHQGKLSFLHRIHVDSCTLWGPQGKNIFCMKFISSLALIKAKKICIKFIYTLAHFEDIKTNFFVAKISRRFLHIDYI